MANDYISSSLFNRLGCAIGQATCSPSPRSPDQCRRLKTCSECLARHPKTFSSPMQVPSSHHNPKLLPWCSILGLSYLVKALHGQAVSNYLTRLFMSSENTSYCVQYCLKVCGRLVFFFFLHCHMIFQISS